MKESNQSNDHTVLPETKSPSTAASDSRPNPPLRKLRDYTSARVALGRAGTSIATSDVLDFQLAHAQARDAVKSEFDADHFAQRLRQELPCLKRFNVPVVILKSAAPDREIYVRRPDLGRILEPDSAACLKACSCDVVFVIADGLSALAPEHNAIALVGGVLSSLSAVGSACGPVCVVKHARVAIGDQIGSLLKASLSVVLIGERPGLSSHDSLGAYITWHPQPGRTDADRNCISNIRNGGLSPTEASARLLWYLKEARVRKITGTALKEQAPDLLHP
ncbi:MAG: ethanolamine ammonia-lyase subunit EutC [Terriglobales bacterium]